jgi:hypothetical protein
LVGAFSGRWAQPKYSVMKIHIGNIVAAFFALAVVVLAYRYGASCRAAFDTIDRMGSQSPGDDRFVGFMVIGLIGIFVVAIVRTVTQQGARENRRRHEDNENDQNWRKTLMVDLIARNLADLRSRPNNSRTVRLAKIQKRDFRNDGDAILVLAPNDRTGSGLRRKRYDSWSISLEASGHRHLRHLLGIARDRVLINVQSRTSIPTPGANMKNSTPKLPVPCEGRIDSAQTAYLLGYPVSAIAFFIQAGLIRPLGSPGPTSPRYFAAVEVRQLAASREWLDRAERAVSRHWQRRNSRRPQKSPNFASTHKTNSFTTKESKLPAL